MQGLKIDTHFKYNSQSGVIKFFNGSEILLKDLFSYPSDPEFDELGSLEITDAFIDEANQVSVKAKQIVRSRIRYKLDENDLTPKLLMTCNPAKNWTYSEFFKPFSENRLSENKKFIQSLVTDNPFISETYIDNLNQLDQQTKERLLYGNWHYSNDPSDLCDYDAICDLFTNDHVTSDGENYISADLAMQGRDRFVAGHWNGLIGYIDYDLEKSTGKEIEEKLIDLKINYSVPNSHISADSDGLGAYLDSYIENIKTFHGGSKAFSSEFANLKSECAFKLAELINSRRIKIYCTLEQQERLKEEIGICLKRHKVDADDQKKRIIPKDLMKEKLGHSPDYLDFLIIRMIFEVNTDAGVVVF